jgi:hypothetical protein
VKRPENVRRTAARKILATLFAAAILTVIPSSGRAQEGGQAINALIVSDRLRALVDDAKEFVRSWRSASRTSQASNRDQVLYRKTKPS